MDFAAEVCDSCGEVFCSNCLVYPRGNKKAPFCTHCAMALSGVRNRRPVKPLPRGEIKKRRKAFRTQLAQDDDQVDHSHMRGSDLINAPEIEEDQLAPEEEESGGRLGRFFRRKTDEPSSPESEFEAIAADLPEPTVTVVGGTDTIDLPPASTPADIDYYPEPEGEFVPASPEHSATAILEQLKEQEATGDENVWLPPAGDEMPTWTLPDLQQSPLGNSGPWEGVATPSESSTEASPTPAAALADSGTPVFVSEADLRAEGPADTDQTGNWVPPTLRGMAPQAQSNGGELPRRRRREEA